MLDIIMGSPFEAPLLSMGLLAVVAVALAVLWVKPWVDDHSSVND